MRKHDGIIGHEATALVAKWKRKVEAANVQSWDKDERLDDTELGTRNNYTDSQENGTSSTPNSNSRDQTVNKSLAVSRSTDSSQSSFSGKRTENCDENISKSQRSRSSVPSDYKETTLSSKRIDCGKTSDKKRRRESDIFDIDSKMSTSFAEALKTLDVLSTSKVKKLPKSSLYKASTPNECTKSGLCSPFDETPILLRKRPQLEPPLHIADEILSRSTITEPMIVEGTIRQPQTQTIQLTDEEVVSYSIVSRTSKTKVFSGNKAGSKCEVPTLFEMCIQILKDNIDCKKSYLGSKNLLTTLLFFFF